MGTRQVLVGFLVFGLMVSGCMTPSQRGETSAEKENAETTASADNENNDSPRIRPGSPESKSIAAYFFSMGEALFLDGYAQEALKFYDMALKSDPTAALVHLKRAAILERLGKYDEALVSAEQARTTEPKNVEVILLAARLYQQKNNPKKAYEYLERAYTLEPGNPEIIYLKGAMSLDKGELDRAMGYFKKLVALDGDYPLGYIMMAEIYRQKNRVPEAVKVLDEALDKYPRLSAAANAKGLLLEAISPEKARVFYEAYLNRPSSERSLNMLTRFAQLELSANNYKGASPILEEICQKDPENINAAIKLGLVYAELHDWTKAEKVFSDVSKKFPESDRVNFYLGLVYDEQGKFKDASIEYAKIPSTSEHYETAQLRDAIILRTQLKEKSRTTLEARYKQFPKQAGYALLIGSIIEDSEGLESSVRYLTAEDVKFPKEERIKIQIASLYDKMGDTIKGVPFMQKILSFNPDNSFAHNFVGYSLLEAGQNLKLAGTHIRKAFQLNPEDPFIIDSYAWYLYKTNKSAEALKHLERAAQMRPNEAVIWDHLAEVYRSKGQLEKARNAYGKAFELYAKDPKKAGEIQAKLEALQYEKPRLPAGAAR